VAFGWGHILFSPTAKRILEQEKSTIDFEKIINEDKILICNLSKSKLGKNNSKVFGVIVMAKLQLAASRRARMDFEKRKDFYLNEVCRPSIEVKKSSPSILS